MIPAHSNPNLAQLRLMRDRLIEQMVEAWPQYQFQIEAVARQQEERFSSMLVLRQVQDYTFSRVGLDEFANLCERIAVLERETVKQLREQARV